MATAMHNFDSSIGARRPIGLPPAAPASLTRLLDRAAAALAAWRHPATVVEMVQTGLAHLRDTLDRDRWLAVCAFTQAHELMASLRQDPLIARSLDKPRGVAGDAVLLDLVGRHPDRQGELRKASALGRALYLATTGTPAALAVRARRQRLAGLIDATAARSERPAVLALGAGHLREAELSTAMAAGRIGRFVALDSDERAGAIVAGRHGRRVEIVTESVSAVLRGALAAAPAKAMAAAGNAADGGFDLIYAAGLFDYLDTRLATRVVRAAAEQLAPGGRLVFGNFADDLWEAGFMEAAMGWHLILRDETELTTLLTAATRGLAGITTSIDRPGNGPILYAEVCRTA